MDKSTVNVTALEGNNYATWKIQVKMLLMKENLYGIVEGKEAAPAATDEKGLKDFNARRDRALAIIVLSISAKLLYIIGDPDDPKKVWEKLRDTYQKKSWANKLRLKRRLYNMKLKPSESLQQHLKNFIEIFDELAVIGEALAEEDKVISLLASLPDTFSVLVTTLEAMDKVPSWEDVMERLLHENEKMTSKKESSSSEDKVLYSKRFNNTRKCFECNEPGHIRKNCKLLKKSKRDFKKGTANAAQQIEQEDEEVSLYTAGLLTSKRNDTRNEWIIDSGCTHHMCSDQEMFREYEELSADMKVEMGDGTPLVARGRGSVALKLNQQGSQVNCVLTNVLHVPGLIYNLISVSQCVKKGKQVLFEDDSCKIVHHGSVIARGKKLKNLYVLDTCPTAKSFVASEKTPDPDLWHRRFCHIGINNINKMIREELVNGLDIKTTSQQDFSCEDCHHGKQARIPFPSKEETPRRKPFELIHSDVCGKISPKSHGGKQYFVTFIDDATRFCWVFVLQNKSDVFENFKKWKIKVENQYEAKVKILRSDNGGEYVSAQFQEYLEENGIEHQKTIPKTPQQNGLAERKNRTLIETIRCMIHDSKIDKSFWAEALFTANYVLNRSPSAALKDKTPYEVLHRKKPNVKYFRTFGCTTHAHIPEDERKKLDSKSRKTIFLGYGTNVKGYRLYDPETRKIFYARNVIFNEKREAQLQKETSATDPDVPTQLEFVFDSNIDSTHPVETPNQDATRRSSRISRPPDRYGFACNMVQDLPEPKNLEEALSGPESEEWSEAIKREMEAMQENEVWELVKKPENCNLIKSKWIFKRKLGADGNIASYKARLVAQGYSQKFGVDYQDTFSPVVRFESIRTILCVSTKLDLQVHQMDVSSAFLNGHLEENLYMQQPKGFIKNGNDYVCHLKKSIYGLKQSSKCWNKSLHQLLQELGFKQSSSDSCVYFSLEPFCILAVYVDDMILACESGDYLKKLKQRLGEKFKMKDLGPIKQFLGINIIQEKSSTFINQSTFTKALLKKFQFENCKPIATPVDVSQKLVNSEEDSELFDPETYQSAVGALLYLSTRTRPDISYAVSNISKFSSKPSKQHWQAVKRIFRYLNGTIDYGILYEKEKISECFGYSDADWAGDQTDRKSTSGHCFTIGSGIVTWKSNKQTCVALSTAEAEYVALSSAAQEAVWMQKLLQEIKFAKAEPILIYEDNQSAIGLAKSSRHHVKSKHIDIKYNFIRSQVEEKRIIVEYCPTENMIADLFTKGLPSEKFKRLRSALGMRSLNAIHPN